MPRPATKTTILSESRKEYAALEQLLATLSPDEMAQPGLMAEWSAKDALACRLCSVRSNSTRRQT